ncbi:DNA glycosylase [Chytriomyces cf. hyalinus JEL632]|nr:DNA glycosylase [Chytriomyces cf. hyalinus JEL632]
MLGPMPAHNAEYHRFSSSHVSQVRRLLIDWYAQSKRPLPWRNPNPDENENAYRVWVSEIMCQQTRVDTVIPYFNKWTETWPTVHALAVADPEAVRSVWSGLGYYSRASRLLEGAIIVVNKFKGVMPKDAETLQKEIPGIGRYTAGAIASIAFNQATPLVDGNVVRVLSRMRALGMDPKSKTAVDLHWSLAADIVDPDQPGDFNQSLMELGATICTPTNPDCAACPVKEYCRAFELHTVSTEKAKAALQAPRKMKRKIIDDDAEDESSCALCLPVTDIEDCGALLVTRYPVVPKKKAAEEKEVLVPIIELRIPDQPSKFLVMQRPPKGLLANLWDFPHIPTTEELSPLTDFSSENLVDSIPNTSLSKSSLTIKIEKPFEPIKHLFSHIKLTMNIVWLTAQLPDGISELPANDAATKNCAWWTEEEMETGAVPVTLKKALKLVTDDRKGGSKTGAQQGTIKKKAKKGANVKDAAQPSISNFFSRK